MMKIYIKKKDKKRVSSEPDSQLKLTNQTYDLGHLIGMTL